MVGLSVVVGSSEVVGTSVVVMVVGRQEVITEPYRHDAQCIGTVLQGLVQASSMRAPIHVLQDSETETSLPTHVPRLLLEIHWPMRYCQSLLSSHFSSSLEHESSAITEQTRTMPDRAIRPRIVIYPGRFLPHK